MRFSQVLIFLFCFLLPVGWAKHWIVPNSLVGGVLVDYLMPDVWFQDVIAIIIIAQILLTRYLKFASLRLKYLISPRNRGVNITTVISGLFVLISVILSPVPLISTINFIRFLLAMTLSLIIYKNKKLQKPALVGLSGAVIWTTLLATAQFINQGTVLGWQFLGEPIFSPGSGGVKKIFLFGQRLVAPMATFPHANVMGAFGLLYLVYSDQMSVSECVEESLSRQPRLNSNLFNKLFHASRWFSFLLIFLSFSLPVWLIALYFIIRKFKCAIAHLILSIVGLVLVLRVAGYALPITSFHRRWNLIQHSLQMIKAHPFFGVGWGGFVKQLPPSTFLQPVHNVFLLILSELGIIGAGGLVLVLREYFKKFDIKALMPLCLPAFLLFLVDHYFWTTTQGVYILWVLISLL